MRYQVGTNIRKPSTITIPRSIVFFPETKVSRFGQRRSKKTETRIQSEPAEMSKNKNLCSRNAAAIAPNATHIQIAANKKSWLFGFLIHIKMKRNTVANDTQQFFAQDRK